MPDCPDCGRHLVRRHRRFHQKLVYSQAFRCKECNRPVYRLRRFLRSGPLFTWPLFTRCPQCGETDVQGVAAQDRAASPASSGLSRLQRLLGARVYRCEACRFQYHDWRAHPLR